MGHEIVGIDLSQKAFEEFFNEHHMQYTVEDLGDFKLYAVYIFESKI